MLCTVQQGMLMMLCYYNLTLVVVLLPIIFRNIRQYKQIYNKNYHVKQRNGITCS
jgi:hypothetical protein